MRREVSDVEIPVESDRAGAHACWGSDLLAQALRDCDIPYVAMVPGASFRGLQDSLVNLLGNRQPQLIVCLHEEHAVAIAHGYAKATGKPMAAALHSNVGLMHAAMTVFNAYSDRAPVLVLGATGPVDAMLRRPWIDWIHTSRDQGSLVRGYVKWDEQPGSAAAAAEAIFRAFQLINAEPKGPVYLCFDVADQEARLPDGFRPSVEPSRFRQIASPRPSAETVSAAAGFLAEAKHPVILAGRCSRSEQGWYRRLALAEQLGARVITDIKTGSAFPTGHQCHVGAPAYFLSSEQRQALVEADVILALDWIDVGGTLRQAFGTAEECPAKVITASLDEFLINGWNYDHFALAPVDLKLSCTTDAAVEAICAVLNIGEVEPGDARTTRKSTPTSKLAAGPIDQIALARALTAALDGFRPSYLKLPLGWPAQETPFTSPLCYLGADGGGGIGAGPGLAVGGALGLAGTGRLPVAVVGDGDFLMGASSIWTAAHYNIPLLLIVSNNQSFYNDEEHQSRIAALRSRPVENNWIGQRLDHPEIDVAALAKSFGVHTGPTVRDAAELPSALGAAIEQVLAGGVAVVDVHVLRGYATELTK